MKITRRGFDLLVERQVIHGYESNNERYVCRECGPSASMMTVETASRISHTTSRELFRLIENGGVHFIELPAGGVLVCRNSLEARGVLK